MHELLREQGIALTRGESVARYVVMSRLGAGGMGEVHAAYDPDLDRKVALKLLRRDRYPSAVASRRLLREAQALARLAHPNVVAIHDVGTHAGQVWLAMEFVDGKTLREWWSSASRTWRDIVEVLVAAGRGIAAAHANGLLHRDIKPDNIMVADDGRVRVMDFGLARFADHDEPELPVEPAHDTVSRARTSSLTAQGMAVGTPAYTAPELVRGAEADARSDQYSFCITLWEALHGERPRPHATLSVDAASDGTRPALARVRGVPSWLWRICERGLADDPDARWPSMDALVDALVGGRARSSRRMASLVLAGVGAGLLALLGWRELHDSAQRRRCATQARDIEQVWNPDERERIAQSMRESGFVNAEATSERVGPLLDAWTDEWTRAREQLCLEAEVDGAWAPALASAGRECFADQLDLLAGLLETLHEVDRTTIARAVPAIAGLPAADRCLDRGLLERLPTATSDQQREALLAGERRSLMRLRGRMTAGDYTTSLADADALLERVEALDAPALATMTRATLGELARLAGDYERAEAVLRRAHTDAGMLRDAELAMAVAQRLAQLTGVDLDRPAEGLAWIESAAVLVSLGSERNDLAFAELLVIQAHLQLKLGAYDGAERDYARALELLRATYGSQHYLTANAINGLAMVYDARGEYERAEQEFERALELRELGLGPDHPIVAASLHNLGTLRWRRGDFESARVVYERSLAIWRATAGPESSHTAGLLYALALLDKSEGHFAEAEAGLREVLAIRERTLDPQHRTVAETLNALAGIESMHGDYELAREHYERALRIWERAVGPEHRTVAEVVSNLAEVERKCGHIELARELHERALAIFEHSLAPDHPSVANTVSNLALIAMSEQDYAQARALNLRALAIREQQLGANHRSVGISLNNLGEVELRLGQLADARAHYTRALELFETNLGREHLHVSYPLYGLAEVALAERDFTRARSLLERALELREAQAASPEDRAELRFALAKALRGQGHEALARTTAELARDEYRTSGREQQAAEITRWLGVRSSG